MSTAPKGRAHLVERAVEAMGGMVHYCSPRFIGQNLVKVFGGENEWFGEFRITCHFPTVEPREWWG